MANINIRICIEVVILGSTCVFICICIFFKVRSYDLCSLHLRRFLFTPFFFFFIIATLSLSTQQSVLQ